MDMFPVLVSIPVYDRRERTPNWHRAPAWMPAHIDLSNSTTYGWISFDRGRVWCKPGEEWIFEYDGDPEPGPDGLAQLALSTEIRAIYENRSWRDAPREWVDAA